MISIICSILGFITATWFFLGMAWSLKKSPMITDAAAMPVWLIMLMALIFLGFDIYQNFKKYSKKRK
jgi:hypothetical protein